MKKHLLLIALLFVYGTKVYSQVTLANVVNQYYTPDNTAPLDAHLDVINGNNSAVDISIIRTIEAKTPTHDELFCFGLYCYLPGTDTSLYLTTINPGSTESTFKPEISPNNTDGYDRMHYRIFDYNNPSDSVGVTIEFFINVTQGLVENSNDSYLKFKNQVNNFAAFNYKLLTTSGNARIDIHNMLGSKMNSIPLNEKQGTKIVTTNDLSNGIYLVSLVINNKTSHSYRMVVNHQSN